MTSLALLLLLLLLPLLAPLSHAWSLDERCQTCSGIMRAFGDGLKRTKGANFGGGNTAWEERKLGRFATSETRLVDIVEKLCSESKQTKLCHQMVEEQEDFVETWWQSLGQQLEKRGLDDVPTDATVELYNKLCVERLEACCPIGHFGATCVPCPSDCNGHGHCRGNGSRSGDGTCVCREGYQGTLCDACKVEGFFRTAENHCAPCSPACKKCSGPGPEKCDGCARGYQEVGGRCADINECAGGGSGPCAAEREFCENTAGSYRCRGCSEACSGCSGPGADQCKQCAPGHQLNVSGACSDINECSADSQLCRGPHQVCRNTIGSFKCDCVTGFRLERDVCVPLPVTPSAGSSNARRKQKLTDEAKKKKKKRIWTKRFTREFLKFIGAVAVLGVGSHLLKGRVLPVLGMAVGCGAFLYSESLRLDNAFMRKKVL